MQVRKKAEMNRSLVKAGEQMGRFSIEVLKVYYN